MNVFWMVIVSLIITIHVIGMLVVGTTLAIVALQDGWWFTWDIIKPWKWNWSVVFRGFLVIFIWEIILFL